MLCRGSLRDLAGTHLVEPVQDLLGKQFGRSTFDIKEDSIESLSPNYGHSASALIPNLKVI